MSQSKMLKADILKILAKDVSGGSNTRKPYKSAKQPLTFFGGADNQPYYPLAQEPAPSANPATPIVPQIVTLEPGQKSGKRPTYKNAKEPNTFFGGAKDPKCKKAEQQVVKFCAESSGTFAPKKAKGKAKGKAEGKAKRAPSAYNLFIKDFFSKNKGATMKSAAAAWKASQSGAPKPATPRAPIALTTFQPPAPPSAPPPAKKKKLKIVDRKKPAAAPAPKPAKKAKAEKKPTFEEFWSKLINEEGFDEEYHADDTNYDRARAAARRDAKKIWKERYPKKAAAPKKPKQSTGATGTSLTLTKEEKAAQRKKELADNSRGVEESRADYNKELERYDISRAEYLKFVEANQDKLDNLLKVLPRKMSFAGPQLVGSTKVSPRNLGDYFSNYKTDPRFITASYRAAIEFAKKLIKENDEFWVGSKEKKKKRLFTPTDALYEKFRARFEDASGGRMPNTGKPLPEQQLQSFAQKKPSAPRTKKNSTWMAHLAEFRKANPTIKARDMMKAAKQTYKKGGAHCGGAQNHCNAPPPIDGDQIGVGGAAIKPDIKMTEETHTMPDGSIMPGKTHGGEMVLPGQVKQLMVEKMAGNLPTAPEKLPEKSAKDQTQIMVDIMNSYDTFNKRFEDISNSAATIDDKRSQYNSERERIDKFHSNTIQNYGETLSPDNKRIEEKAYQYALETYNIGSGSLTSGEPQQRVDFENFDDNDTITEIIDKALAVPRTALDRARSFFSVPIKDQPIQTFNPVIPALGKMATIYPYGYQMAEKQMRGGKAKKTPKQMITQLTRDLFIREMGKKYPEVPTKKIIAAYEKNKGDIRSIVTDMIIDAIEVRGGADCGPNQYASGERCFNKQPRPDNFDRDKFFADQKGAVAAKERRDDGMVKPEAARTLPSINSSTKTSSDAANPLPRPKPQDKTEKDFVENFSSSITPPDSGPIFGTRGDDIASPKDWVDTLANIFIGTATGVSSIFSALGDIF